MEYFGPAPAVIINDILNSETEPPLLFETHTDQLDWFAMSPIKLRRELGARTPIYERPLPAPVKLKQISMDDQHHHHHRCYYQYYYLMGWILSLIESVRQRHLEAKRNTNKKKKVKEEEKEEKEGRKLNKWFEGKEIKKEGKVRRRREEEGGSRRATGICVTDAAESENVSISRR